MEPAAGGGTRGGGGCLALVPDAGGRLRFYSHSELRGRLERLADKGEAGSENLVVMFAMAVLVRPDARGRVVIPAAILRRSGLTADVVLVGAGDHIQIWPREQWRRGGGA